MNRTTQSTGRKVWAALRHDRLAMVMAGYLVVAILVAFLAPLLAPYDPLAQDLGATLEGPSAAHWLGTDDLGRDVLSRLMYGARISFTASLLAVGVAVVISLPLGLVTGYRGGWLDTVVMRLLDVLLALPGLVLIIAVASVLGGGLTNTMIALSLAYVPILTRIVRAETLAVREETFIEVSRSIGSGTSRILGRRILRNVAPPLLVQTAITCGLAMGAEAALSFIGLGAQAPEASWGSILRRSYDSIFIYPYGVLVPALLITLTAWAFNSLGDAFGAALGVRTSTKRKGFRSLTAVERTTAPERPARKLFEVDDLSVAVDTEDGRRRLTDGVSFGVGRGRVLGIVGESGSGKTVTAMSVTRLFASPPGVITEGSVRLEDADITRMTFDELRELRGRDISMIFQNPKSSLNPALTVGRQIVEVLRWHTDLDARAARAEAVRLLERVEVPAERIDDYPHQLSGGMCQRVMVAMALACRPPLLVADEPTSALDVTVQAEILDLLHELKRDGTTIVLITHDFGVVADICDDVLVMYSGEVVEQGPVAEVLTTPAHPYTRALLDALPTAVEPGERLAAIEGQIPPAGTDLPGCRFAERCRYAEAACHSAPVALDVWRSGDRSARCLRVVDLLDPRAVAPGGRAGSVKGVSGVGVD